jgi:arylsulfatase A
VFAAKAAAKPNVIVIYNDDQGYQDLGCFGSPNIQTPRIDQLAKEGVRFTEFYSSSSVRSGNWKYNKSQAFTGAKHTRTDESSALYNLKDDIRESKNVIAQHPEIAARLAKALDEHLIRVK